MTSRGLRKRLQRLESHTAAQREIILQFARLHMLPRAYQGERHTVTLGRNERGQYLMEERPGPAPVSDSCESDELESQADIIRICFVEAKDGDFA